MKKEISIDAPIFIPKLSQTESAFLNNVKVSTVIMDAHIVAWRPKIANKIKKSVDNFIIDPVTNYFVGKSYKEKASFQKLNTAPSKPYKIDDLLTNEYLRKEEMVWLNIKNQIDEGSSVIIIPYIYTDSIDDTRFGINLSMISDAIKLIKEKNIKIPLYAMINMGSETLKDYSKLDYIVNRYYEDFKKNISGFFLMFDQLDCRKANEDSLMGLAYLTFNLSNNKKVFNLKIDDFGEVLSVISAGGYSSGLAQGESFSAKSLSEKSFAIGRRHKEITYVPELFNYLNDEELRKMKYSCNCSICKNGLPDGYNPTKAHFLEKKLERMKILNTITQGKRTNFLILKIVEAIKSSKEYNDKYLLSIKYDFLYKWKNVLEKSKNWTYSDKIKDEVDLDHLIEEAKDRISKEQNE